MLKNKMKKLICGITMCITVCSQLIFPQIAFAATKVAVEKAGEAFVAGMTETAEAEEVLSEEEIRQQIVDFALQFEGNPYVYGGTSLTNGADCSGFVMSVFAQFGYSLPRVAADQYNQSVKKSVEDLEPGDLDRLFTQVHLRLGSRFPTMIMRHLWELELILKRTASLVNKSEGAGHLIKRI